MATIYKPTDWAINNYVKCFGLSATIAALQAEGCTVLVDFEDYREEVNNKTVNMAVAEMDETWLLVIKDRKKMAALFVIPDPEDWLADAWLREDAPESIKSIINAL